MKRYLVVAFHNFYPDGGMSNIRGHYDTLEDAEAIAKEYKDFGYDHATVVDSHTWEPNNSDELRTIIKYNHKNRMPY